MNDASATADVVTSAPATAGAFSPASTAVDAFNPASATADAFKTSPYTPSEVRFHLIGSALNGTVLLGGLVWLVATWRAHPPSWPWVVLAVLAGFYAAELVSGLLHWAGLLLSVPHHIQHHSGNHDYNYCLINGWADQTLGRLGLFRALEWLIARWSGARPQENDHEWLRRFGRKVVGRKPGSRWWRLIHCPGGSGVRRPL